MIMQKRQLKLKDNGIKVFTVGFALRDKGKKFLEGDKDNSENYPELHLKVVHLMRIMQMTLLKFLRQSKNSY